MPQSIIYVMDVRGYYEARINSVEEYQQTITIARRLGDRLVRAFNVPSTFGADAWALAMEFAGDQNERKKPDLRTLEDQIRNLTQTQ